MRAASGISIGDRARAARKKLGLNQGEVAERVGISTEVYGRFERGLVTPRIQTLLKLCGVLKVTPNDLLLGGLPDAGGAIADLATADRRRLDAVLEGADPTTIKRVTEVARWLRPIEQAQHASRAAERPGSPWTKRKTKRPRR